MNPSKLFSPTTDFFLEPNTLTVFVGASRSGKTTLMMEAVKDRQKLYGLTKIKKLVLIGRVLEQEMYKQLLENAQKGDSTVQEVVVQSELSPEMGTLEYWNAGGGGNDETSFLLLDDMLPQDLKKYQNTLDVLAKAISHHGRVTILICVQELGGQDYYKNILSNTSFLVVLRSSFNSQLLITLQKKIFAGQSGLLRKAYDFCIAHGMSHLLLDLRHHVDEKKRIKTGVFSSENIDTPVLGYYFEYE